LIVLYLLIGKFLELINLSDNWPEDDPSIPATLMNM